MRRLLRRAQTAPAATAATGGGGGGSAAVDDARPTDAGPDRSTLRSRKRFARRQWRRRWLAWKYVIALVLVIVLLCAGIWAVYFSSWLEVKAVDVQGTGRYVTADQVRNFARAPLGGPLVTADLGAVRLRVQANLPAIRTVDVSREWPDKILIKVTERTPVAVVSIGGELRALDRDGTVFLRYVKAPAGLPRVSSVAGASTEALSEAAKVAAALPPAIGHQVDHVQVTTVDSISLELHDGRTVVWGGSADSATKAQVLIALMKAAPHAHQYNVSVPGFPATR